MTDLKSFNQFQHLEILLSSNLDKPAVIDFSVLTNLFIGSGGGLPRFIQRGETGVEGYFLLSLSSQQLWNRLVKT